jgi:hypothetical protein
VLSAPSLLLFGEFVARSWLSVWNEIKNRFSTHLELSKREDIVVTKNGRPAVILHAVTDEDIEDYLFESDPRFIAA